MRRLTIARTLIVMGLATLAGMTVRAMPEDRKLRIVAIDVEGGGGTLLVTPEGKSLLLDAGWATGMGHPAGAASGPSSADRIVAIAKRMGLARIDVLLVTHYHADHAGGVPELLARFPIGTVVDHGTNLEPLKHGAVSTPSQAAVLFQKYEAAMRGHKRMIVKAGDHFQVGTVRIDVTNAAGQVLAQPLANARAVACPGQSPETGVSDENDASIGIVATFGRARIASLGDTTQKVERRMVCPINRIGAIDLLIVSHHGSSLSSSVELLAAVAARVALVGNGAVKGGDAQTLERLRASPSHPAIWQLHGATRSPALDVEDVRIANPAGSPDAMNPLVATVSLDGTVMIENRRNHVSVSYPPGS